MKVCGVTVTGADDRVAHEDMARLSAEFPFLEWGILYSASRHGTARYPSIEWSRELQNRAYASARVRLSAHLCGSMARACMAGVIGPLYGVGPDFQRVQVNGYEAGRAKSLRAPFAEPEGFEFILQARNEEELQVAALDAVTAGRCAVLYDPSGGTGQRLKLPSRLPPATVGLRVGFAGGVAPSNVAEVLGEVREVNDGDWPAWLDMESGVRDAGDRLDLAAVRSVLETVARVCAGGGS